MSIRNEKYGKRLQVRSFGSVNDASTSDTEGVSG